MGDAAVKLVLSGSQVLPEVAALPHFNWECWRRDASAELDELLGFIEAEDIRGVVFASGDPHLGQVDQKCDTCHTTSTFAVGNTFAHTGMDDFFKGFHGRYACVDCHKKERRQYPAGIGIAVRFAVGRTCAACHPNF